MSAPVRRAARAGRRPVGPGLVLAAAYAVLVIAAGARSAVQLATRAGEAPVAYGLSAAAAVVYLTELLLVVRVDLAPPSAAPGAEAPARWVRAARRVAVLELAGVLVVGAASVVVPGAFGDASVWSGFGAGYGWTPLALPLAALWWLRRR